MTRDLVAAVRTALLRDRQIRAVELVGSRAAGTARPLSDWDFAVECEDFESVAERLPRLVRPLEPLAAQWDPLGRVRTYMLMLTGPVKVDLIFDVPQDESPPWVVSPATRQLIDRHFWDWALWLAAKEAAGKTALVEGELRRLHRHLLEPLGVKAEPRSVDEAIAEYLAVRKEPSALEREVLPALERRGA